VAHRRKNNNNTGLEQGKYEMTKLFIFGLAIPFKSDLSVSVLFDATVMYA